MSNLNRLDPIMGEIWRCRSDSIPISIELKNSLFELKIQRKNIQLCNAYNERCYKFIEDYGLMKYVLSNKDISIEMIIAIIRRGAPGLSLPDKAPGTMIMRGPPGIFINDDNIHRHIRY